jgi:hypothetical protein
MPDCVTAATHFGTLNFSGLLNNKYDLVIIDVHARKELYFIVHKKLSCKLRIHQAVSCINRVCCTCYTVISTLCIFRLCHKLWTNLFISGVFQMSNVEFRINQHFISLL